MNSSFRYLLSRTTTAQSNSTLLVCMLNPSTADEEKNDPTISRICRLAENGGFSRLLVLNLFAIRATNPTDIWFHKDPIGVENWRTWDEVLQRLLPGEDSISVAWGRAPSSRSKLLQFFPALIEASNRLQQWPSLLTTWVRNLDGSPRHPLYINKNTKLQPYNLHCYIKDLLQRNNVEMSLIDGKFSKE
jgi:hypothetical protein